MKNISIAYVLFGLFPLTLLITACSTPRENFTASSFSNNSPYQQHVSVSSPLACAAAERTLLGDGYSLDSSAKVGTVKGRKAYLLDGGRSNFLEMSIVCLPDATGSTIYANGLISRYDLKKSANAASVGVSVLGTISMPIGQSVDSMVKVSDETIRDRVFYKNFFAAVEGVLNDPLLEAASPLAAPAPSPVPSPASPAHPLTQAPIAALVPVLPPFAPQPHAQASMHAVTQPVAQGIAPVLPALPSSPSPSLPVSAVAPNDTPGVIPDIIPAAISGAMPDEKSNSEPAQVTVETANPLLEKQFKSDKTDIQFAPASSPASAVLPNSQTQPTAVAAPINAEPIEPTPLPPAEPATLSHTN